MNAHRILLLAAIALSLAACLSSRDRASLALLEGDARLPALSAPVSVERDRVGATRYIADNLRDAVRAQGYAHAQERFAQMDTLRRAASGRLAELGGPSLVETDRASRATGFHRAARRALDALPPRHRELLDAYTEGVNSGLAALGGPPPEHRILNVTPAPWEPIDCVNVAYALSAALLTGSYGEMRLKPLVETYADDPETLAFLLPPTTRFDALADGSNDYAPLPIPPARDDGGAQQSSITPPRPPLGSNNFAVSGAHTADGRAILAGDMHLQLTMPPIWRHEHLVFGDRFAVGVSLPGVPGIVAGSNGRIAWAFTNVTGDFADQTILEINPDDEDQYKGPDGWAPISEREETIEVRGGRARRVTVRETEWGPIVGEDSDGNPIALRRSDIAPEPINFALLDFVTAVTLEEGVAIAQAWRGPPQNALIADDRGRIAWTITGYLPRRVNTDGRTPIDVAQGQGWAGELPSEERPTIIEPEDGYLATANSRTVPERVAPLIGTQWDLGARAQRIHELLREKGDQIEEEDLLEIQLDTRVHAYEAVRPYILGAIDEDDENKRLRYARDIIERWNGRADADSAEYRLVRWASMRVLSAALDSFFEPVYDAEAGWTPGSPIDFIEPALRVLEEQPESHLPEGRDAWRDVIRRAVLRALDDIRDSDDTRAEMPWGERIALRMTHPLSGALQWLASSLDMPSHPQHGDVLAVRVATPTIGASQRMVVSPGRERDAIFHMPGGQSGHPLSPYYRAGHEAWRDGEATPLLPGPTVHRLELSPGP